MFKKRNFFPTLRGPFFWYDRQYHAGWIVQKHYKKDLYRILNPQGDMVEQGDEKLCLQVFAKIKHSYHWKGDHAVLLLHGIAGVKQSFDKMAIALKEEGFETIAINYASIRGSVNQHVENTIHLLNDLQGIHKLSIVTQSMGGLIMRLVLSKASLWQHGIYLDKMVMITPPNHGSSLANLALKIPFHSFIWGPSLYDLRPQDAKALPLINIPFMVITGYTGHKWGYMPIMGEDNDGLVAVSATPLDNMQHNVYVKDSHYTITKNKKTIETTVKYLTGQTIEKEE